MLVRLWYGYWNIAGKVYAWLPEFTGVAAGCKVFSTIGDAIFDCHFSLFTVSAGDVVSAFPFLPICIHKSNLLNNINQTFDKSFKNPKALDDNQQIDHSFFYFSAVLIPFSSFYAHAHDNRGCNLLCFIPRR